ncbi:hypothetical protein Pcinc_042640 [Petrolisthes cinctipes]|uniref:Uncharacterized protein n=1 Tax=Petrolisthes cinctipes TaxID=88211 RepID=A0AAE1BHC7_PETCI|nr:hypothetical protein Pcinc_042640 [Petrolisthes cinctipes]
MGREDGTGGYEVNVVDLDTPPHPYLPSTLPLSLFDVCEKGHSVEVMMTLPPSWRVSSIANPASTTRPTMGRNLLSKCCHFNHYDLRATPPEYLTLRWRHNTHHSAVQVCS